MGPPCRSHRCSAKNLPCRIKIYPMLNYHELSLWSDYGICQMGLYIFGNWVERQKNRVKNREDQNFLSLF